MGEGGVVGPVAINILKLLIVVGFNLILKVLKSSSRMILSDILAVIWDAGGRSGEPTSKQKEVSLAVDGKRSPLFTLGTRIGLPWIAHIHDYNLNLVFDSPTHEYL